MNEDEKKAIKVLKVNPKIIAELDKDLLYKMFEIEGQSIEELKDWSYKIVLNLIKKQQKEISELKADRVEKDKIIDLMAIAIGNEPLPTEEYCIFRNFDCQTVGGNRDCKKCVKQYFEKKVRNKNE